MPGRHQVSLRTSWESLQRQKSWWADIPNQPHLRKPVETEQLPQQSPSLSFKSLPSLSPFDLPLPFYSLSKTSLSPLFSTHDRHQLSFPRRRCKPWGSRTFHLPYHFYFPSHLDTTLTFRRCKPWGSRTTSSRRSCLSFAAQWRKRWSGATGWSIGDATIPPGKQWSSWWRCW